jgi:prophage regulatory protein
MQKKLYRIKDLSQILSIGESTIWRFVSDPTFSFPKPIKITPKLTTWLAADIDQWIKDHSDLLIKKNKGEKNDF